MSKSGDGPMTGPGTTGKYLLLSVNDCAYAVDIAYVHKVVRLPDISVLTRTRPHILGITKADGEVYAVVDLCVLLGARLKPLRRQTMAVLLVWGEVKVCAVVDAVLSVVPIDRGLAARAFPPNAASMGRSRSKTRSCPCCR